MQKKKLSVKTPVLLTSLRSYSLATFYLGEHIHLKKIQAEAKHYPVLDNDQPLVLGLGEDKYAVLTSFGTVTFWNATKKQMEDVMADIKPNINFQKERYPYEDTLKVNIGGETEAITFEEVYLKELNLEKIKIISYVSAQSVALNRYEEEIDKRLEELGKVVEDLKAKGRTKANQAMLLKQVGNVLSVKQHAVSHLALFDKPETTWDHPDIEQLYIKLRNEYELKDRFDILNEKIDFLSENNTTLINFISAQQSHFLEIVVIWLIALEIALFLVEIFQMVPK